MSSDGVTSTAGFAYVALRMDKAVGCNVVPGCTVRVLERLALKKALVSALVATGRRLIVGLSIKRELSFSCI